MRTISISIYRDGVWAGTGAVDSGGHIVCSAVLGTDQDASDETYDEIESDLDDGHTSGRVERPDGLYEWRLDRPY